jgi:hypothetical protein
VQAEERILHDVLGRGAVPGEQQREPHQPQRMIPVQILDLRLRESPHAHVTREPAKCCMPGWTARRGHDHLVTFG